MSTFRLAIAVPSGHTWPADFSMCLLNLVLHCMQKAIPGFERSIVKIFNKRTSLLPKSRQELIDDALAADCTHLLFVDSDQTFPSNLVHMLMRHGKNVVACNIATKTIPASPTARNRNLEWEGGDTVFTNADSKGVERVWRIGTGVLLLNLQIMQHIPKPWFQITWYPELKDFKGEDWFFCEQLEKAGVAIWIDHDASKAVGHIGNYEYTHDDVTEEVREETAKMRAAANG